MLPNSINFGLIDQIPNVNNETQDVDGTVGLFWYLLHYSILTDDDLTTFLVECMVNQTLSNQQGINLKRNSARQENVLMCAILRSSGGYCPQSSSLATTNGSVEQFDHNITNTTNVKCHQKSTFIGAVFNDIMLFKLLLHVGTNISEVMLYKDSYGRDIRDYLYWCNSQRYVPLFVRFVEQFFERHGPK